MKRILITGAAGQIGVALRSGLRGSYPLIRLVDIAPLGKTEVGEEIVAADIRDIAAMEKVLTDIDCVVHLAGASVESPWDKVLPLNIEGCYNTFEAARRQGVKRVIFASSNHAVGFHRRERFIDNTVPQEPCSTRDQSSRHPRGGELVHRNPARGDQDEHGHRVCNPRTPYSLPFHLSRHCSSADASVFKLHRALGESKGWRALILGDRGTHNSHSRRLPGKRSSLSS